MSALFWIVKQCLLIAEMVRVAPVIAGKPYWRERAEVIAAGFAMIHIALSWYILAFVPKKSSRGPASSFREHSTT